MANVSVRLMVAIFCLVIVVSPALLLTFLSDAADRAANSVIPPFYRSATRGVTQAVVAQLQALAADTLAAQTILEHAMRSLPEYNAACGGSSSSGSGSSGSSGVPAPRAFRLDTGALCASLHNRSSLYVLNDTATATAAFVPVRVGAGVGPWTSYAPPHSWRAPPGTPTHSASRSHSQTATLQPQRVSTLSRTTTHTLQVPSHTRELAGVDPRAFDLSLLCPPWRDVHPGDRAAADYTGVSLPVPSLFDDVSQLQPGCLADAAGPRPVRVPALRWFPYDRTAVAAAVGATTAPKHRDLGVDATRRQILNGREPWEGDPTARLAAHLGAHLHDAHVMAVPAFTSLGAGATPASPSRSASVTPTLPRRPTATTSATIPELQRAEVGWLGTAARVAANPLQDMFGGTASSSTSTRLVRQLPDDRAASALLWDAEYVLDPAARPTEVPVTWSAAQLGVTPPRFASQREATAYRIVFNGTAPQYVTPGTVASSRRVTRVVNELAERNAGYLLDTPSLPHVVATLYDTLDTLAAALPEGVGSAAVLATMLGQGTTVERAAGRAANAGEAAAVNYTFDGGVNALFQASDASSSATALQAIGTEMFVLRRESETCRYTTAAQSIVCITDVFLLEPTCTLAHYEDAVQPSAPQMRARRARDTLRRATWNKDAPSTGTSDSCAMVLRRLSVLLVTSDPNNSAGSDLFSGAQAISVVVGVSMSAAAIVLVLSLLHYVFHPLKVIGAILRCLADINFNELDAMEPSHIKELYTMQRNVDKLIARMRQYGRYMPDKSQLNAVLETEVDLKSFGETDVSLAPLKQQHAVGSVPHTVTVIAEYRSRKRPHLNRGIDDLKKNCTFSLVFSSGDDVHNLLLSQCRVRFGERIGEPLQLLDKGRERRRRIGVTEAAPLTTTDDVLHAIEHVRDNTLHLLVVKVSRKNFAPWIILAITFAATILTMRLCALWAQDDDVLIRRAIGLAAFAVGTRLFINLLACMYLLRRFVLTNHDFALWLPLALQEVVLVILCGAFTVNALFILFSHTRITRVLRFNAPGSQNSDRLIHKYSVPGHVLGDLVPLLAFTFIGVTNRATHLTPLLVATFTLLSASMIAVVLQRTVRTIIRMLRSRSSLARSLIQETEQERLERELRDGEEQMLSVAMQSAAGATSTEGRTAGGGGQSPNATAMMAQAAPPALDPQQRMNAASLGLVEREATLLKLSLRYATTHFASMSTVEIQLFCEKFLTYVFAETKVYGGMVMRVRGCDVLICFNCHRRLPRHVLGAVRCFFAIERNVAANVTRWSEDDAASPQLFGSVVTGANISIGYTGRSESRSIQHIGLSATVLDALFAVAEHTGAQLLTLPAVADVVEACHRGGDIVQPAAPAPGMGYAAPAALTLNPDHVAGLAVRDVDVLRLPQPGRRFAAGTSDTASNATGHSAAPTHDTDDARSELSLGGEIDKDQMRSVTTFEVVSGMPAEMLLSSRSTFSVLHLSSSGSAVKQHLAKHPTDVVFQHIARWAHRHRAGRVVTPFGAQLYPTEQISQGRDATAKASGKDGQQQHGAGGQHQGGDDADVESRTQEASAGQTHPMLATVLAKDKYVVYFTDL